MKITSSSSSGKSSQMLNTLVDKIYNLLFGWLDSLFDEEYYEKEEKTIPKSQAEKPKEAPVDTEGKEVEVEDEDIEVTGDVKEIKFLPKEASKAEGKDEFTVKITPATLLGDEGFMVQVINNTTGKPSRERWVTKANESKIKETVEDCRKEVSACCRIKLRKITGSSNTSVQLTDITSTYDMTDAITDIVTVVNDKEFQEALPEGDSVYRIDLAGDGYDVNEMEDFDFESSIYADTLDCGFKAFARIQELCWFAKGIDYNNFKSICDCLTYDVQYQITELAKLCIIHGDAPEFEVSSSDASSTLDKWQSLKDCVNGYITMLNALCLVATSDERNMIETWIRQLNDVILYQCSCVASKVGHI